MAPPESPRRLGRGLDALLARKDPRPAAAPASTEAANAPPSGIVVDAANASSTTSPATSTTPAAPPSALQSLLIDSIRANPYQPRKEFRAEELADLESSLRVSGLLQPITVRPVGHGAYELIAGERRFRAATRLGWTEIPAIVRPTDDREALTLAMVENLQRADLDPIEEADGYQRLIDDFALSQQEVADVVGKDRSTVANALRLRQLPASIRGMLQQKQLTAGHARAMLALGSEKAMLELAREAVTNGLSVRDVERRVQAGRAPAAKPGKSAPPSAAAVPAQKGSAESRRIEELLRRKLQTTVTLHLSEKDKGEVRIAFFSNDDLERVLELLGVTLDQ